MSGETSGDVRAMAEALVQLSQTQRTKDDVSVVVIKISRAADLAAGAEAGTRRRQLLEKQSTTASQDASHLIQELARSGASSQETAQLLRTLRKETL